MAALLFWLIPAGAQAQAFDPEFSQLADPDGEAATDPFPPAPELLVPANSPESPLSILGRLEQAYCARDTALLSALLTEDFLYCWPEQHGAGPGTVYKWQTRQTFIGSIQKLFASSQSVSLTVVSVGTITDKILGFHDTQECCAFGVALRLTARDPLGHTKVTDFPATKFRFRIADGRTLVSVWMEDAPSSDVARTE
jgi:hypothetical protein